MGIITNQWNKIIHIEPEKIWELFITEKPDVIGIDTETNGLFHKTSQPFKIVLGWASKDILKTRQAIIFNPTENYLKILYKIVQKSQIVFMHNAKFDLHMLANIYKPLKTHNILDTMTIARLILEALPIYLGGESLALKNLAKKYIEKEADQNQIEIKQAKILLTKNLRNTWKQQINNINEDSKKWSKTLMESLESNPILNIQEHIPPNVYNEWQHFIKKYPKSKGIKTTERITYHNIYLYSQQTKQIMNNYALKDVIYTIELGLKFLPYIINSEQLEILKNESQITNALWESERIGIGIDMDYIKKSKQLLKTEILTNITTLQNILKIDTIKNTSTFVFSPTQIKKYLIQNNYPNNTTTSKEMLKQYIQTEKNITIKNVLNLILQIRQLNKKYSTDLLGYERMEYNGSRYTSFNQNITITGRLSSDLQQLATEGIISQTTNKELFHPRKPIIPRTKEGYDMIVYMDYSQIELRLQAHYTWIATNGQGDLNLLRNYVPFQCINEQQEQWNPKNPKHTQQTFIDKHKWKQIENNQIWTEIDMHLTTAKTAFPNWDSLTQIQKTKYRKLAKNINFAIQYGAGLNTIIEQLKDPIIAQKLVNSNTKLFPGLQDYKKWVIKTYNKNGYVENAYGRKYKTKYRNHKLNNYIIQGTAAEILKRQMMKCHNFLNNYKSRIILTIHDEIQIEIHKSEHHIIPNLKTLIETIDYPFVIPLNINIEYTKTNWQEKQPLWPKGLSP